MSGPRLEESPRPRGVHLPGEALGLDRRGAAPGRRERVDAAALVVTGRPVDLVNELRVEQPRDRAVERAGTDRERAARTPGDVLDDGVAVQAAAGEREEDLELHRGQRP